MCQKERKTPPSDRKVPVMFKGAKHSKLNKYFPTQGRIKKKKPTNIFQFEEKFYFMNALICPCKYIFKAD